MDKEIALRLIESQRNIQPNGCWLWEGAKTSGGYGQITYKWVTYYVHRLSAYVYLDLELDSYLHVLHKNSCHNSLCFNPDHLYLGTNQENAADRKELIYYCKYGHEFTKKNTYYIKGTNKRQCRRCKADREYNRRMIGSKRNKY